MEKNLEYLMLITLTLAITWVLSFTIRRILDALIRRNSLKTDPTNFIFIKNSVSTVLFAFAIFWIFQKIPYFRSLGTALFAGAGVIAAVIGFASQKAFSNIIGGLFILIFKPFRVGDNIEISNNRRGIVEEITLRHTVIKDFQSKRIVIPNSVISDETIVNSSLHDEKIKKHIEIGISYDSDINKAIEVIREEITKHPYTIDNRSTQEIDEGEHIIVVKVISLGDFAVVLRAYVWTENYDHAFDLTCDSLKSIKERFEREGVRIPFPSQSVYLNT
jgi:small-conductance mechanosensitive channel